jgi:chromosome segregation ATPase
MNQNKQIPKLMCIDSMKKSMILKTNERIQHLEDEVRKKDQRIESRDLNVAHLDKLVDRLEEEVRKKDKRIESLQDDLELLGLLIHKMKNKMDGLAELTEAMKRWGDQ